MIHLPALILLVVANAAPVMLAMLLGQRCAAPIDGGRKLPDGEPLFGAHKTWRGLLVAIAAAGGAGVLLSTGFAIGAAFGALAMAGDLTSSFVKRRLRRHSGSWTPLLDQLPEALLPLLVLRDRLGLSLASIVTTTVIFTLADLVAARFAPAARKQPH